MLIVTCQIYVLTLAAQQTDTDSTRLLKEITVQAFNYNRHPHEVPASIGFVDSAVVQSFNDQTIVQAVNTVPGVRMEERSPGSYRLSMRGSTIRSPFGVRNVKVYWNGVPLTDASGNTYLNMLDPAMIGSIEAIKGPGSSLYGAGTGGVLLIKSPAMEPGMRITAGAQGGSYGTEKWPLTLAHGGKHTDKQIQLLRQRSDGFRDQTTMRRDAVHGAFNIRPGSGYHSLKTSIFYADLYYETPGGLTLDEFNSDPTQSRPATQTLPSAKEQEASVKLKSLYASLVHQYDITKQLYLETGLSGNKVDFSNYSIRNVEIREEKTLSARSVLRWSNKSEPMNMLLNFGGEVQHGYLPVSTFENNSGTKGNLLTYDNNAILQYSLFTQGEIQINRVSITAGLSVNKFSYDFDRVVGTTTEKQKLDFPAVIIPRLAMLWKAGKNTSLHASVSRGFSPPTLAEVISSTGELNTDLDAETGTNLEAGLKASWLSGKLNVELSAYSFLINDAIIVQRTQDIAEYFDNAGKTQQNGLETAVSYSFGPWKAWVSHALQSYKFEEYYADPNDFSGNELTGAPSSIFNAGLGWNPGRFFAISTVNVTSRLPLNDANTVYTERYEIVNLKLGYKIFGLEFYGGCENIFDKLYSLGNDINAFGGRYYNAAPGRNFYAGMKVDFRK